MVDSEWSQRFEQSGFGIVPALVPPPILSQLAEAFDRLLQSQPSGVLTSRGVGYGIRNVLDLLPDAVGWLRPTELGSLTKQLCGSEAAIVRALFFDKPPGRSWTLPWHRDRAIALRNGSTELPVGFSNLTQKSGIPHVNAAPELLEQMVTIRLSIDPMHADNGPLVVMPGSHRATADADGDLQSVNPSEIQAVHCGAGDAFVMRPLLAHSSVKSAEGVVDRRRVFHMEFSGVRKLPGGLEWRHYIPIS